MQSEEYFEQFRKNIVGVNQTFVTPFGKKQLHYFDWTASGRLYSPIEERMKNDFGPFVGNTHSESSETGVDMTLAYHMALKIIKDHVHATDSDTLLMTGTGATAAINKLQRIMGLKLSDQAARFSYLTKKKISHSFSSDNKPVVFISHMEHHSNHTSWLECDVDIIVVPIDDRGSIDILALKELLEQYKDRPMKIGSFTACSNVTGIITPIYQLARLMHSYGGYCFVDFAAAAPYVDIIMHPESFEERLDAIFFSVHKFLGGPGTPGVLVFSNALYPNDSPPDQPGGGTVLWTNPWGGRRYYDEISLREDGGTPGFLQTMKAALTIKLKEKMGVKQIIKREKYLTEKTMTGLRKIPGLQLLDDTGQHRLGIISFVIQNLHYNLVVKLLNDRFGIQTRGGCSCAGTYGHCLLHVDQKQSHVISEKVNNGDLSLKPGWIRASLHPTVQNTEVAELVSAVEEIVKNSAVWQKEYRYNPHTNEFIHKSWSLDKQKKKVERWFHD